MNNPNNAKRKKINGIVGSKTIQRKPLIVDGKFFPSHLPKPYPLRSNSLGKSKGSIEGVAGWRNNYHRPNTQPLASERRITIIYDENNIPHKIEQ